MTVSGAAVDVNFPFTANTKCVICVQLSIPSLGAGSIGDNVACFIDIKREPRQQKQKKRRKRPFFTRRRSERKETRGAKIQIEKLL